MATATSFLLVQVEPGRRNEVALALAREDSVDEINTVSGDFDLVARVQTTDDAELAALAERVGAVAGVAWVEHLQGRPGGAP